MSQYKYAEIGDTVYFWFAANTTAGAAGDGATPLYDVRLAGASSSGAPTASGTPTLLTHANYTDGLHEIAIDTTGYAAGEYAVFCTLTISAVNPAGFCGSVKVRTAGTAAVTAALADASSDGVLADAIWNAATASYGSAGSYGLLVETDLDATISSRMATYTQPAGFLAATFPSDPADQSLVIAATNAIIALLPAALVGGRMDVSVGAMAAGSVTSAAIATAAIDADALATDAVTEIANGVWALVLETGFSADRILRIIAGGAAGKLSGGPASPVFRNLSDTADIITGAADSSGNRTAASYGA